MKRPPHPAGRICEAIRAYRRKNDYWPATSDAAFIAQCLEPEIEALVKAGVLERLPLYEGGPKVKVALTERGERLARQFDRDRGVGRP